MKTVGKGRGVPDGREFLDRLESLYFSDSCHRLPNFNIHAVATSGIPPPPHKKKTKKKKKNKKIKTRKKKLIYY